MTAITKFLAGGVALAALATAAPASAQYYPGGGDIVSQIIGSVIGNGYGGGYGGYGSGYGGYGGYAVNRQAVVNQCASAVQAQLSGAGYGGYDAYGYGSNGYNAYGSGRVLGISRVEQRSGGGLTVRGVANSGRSASYGYNGGGQVDLVWKCKTDFRGAIVDLSVNRAQSSYGYNGSYGTSYTPWTNDYSQYGYRRY